MQKRIIHLNLATASGRRLRLSPSSVSQISSHSPFGACAKSAEVLKVLPWNFCSKIDPKVLNRFWQSCWIFVTWYAMTRVTLGCLESPSPRKFHAENGWDLAVLCPFCGLENLGLPWRGRSAECWRIPINTASGLEVARFRNIKIHQYTSNTYTHTVACCNTLFNWCHKKLFFLKKNWIHN